MSLEQAVQALIDEGKITQEDITKAEWKILRDYNLNNIIEDIHSGFCELNHDTECKWYDEEVCGVSAKESPWKMDSHKRWKDLFIAFLKSTQLPIKTLSEEPTSGPDYRFTPR